MRSLALSALAALALAMPASAAPKAAPAVAKDARHGDPELQSLRRQFASALLLSELKLDASQKRALQKTLEEARRTRDALVADPKLAAAREERKAALRGAIEEIHRKGSLSEKTRESLREGAREVADEMDGARDALKTLKGSLKGVLREEQIERLQEMREKGRDGRGGGPGEKKALLRLLLSDEFAAELDR